MRLYDLSFFCSKREDEQDRPTPLRCNAHYEPNNKWPVTLRLTSDDYFGKPSITFWITSVEELLDFKASVIDACNTVIAERIASMKKGPSND